MIVKVVGLFSTEISPRCCSTMFLQLAKPNPVPFCLVVNKGSNILDMFSSGIPSPESMNSKTAKLSLLDILISIFLHRALLELN